MHIQPPPLPPSGSRVGVAVRNLIAGLLTLIMAFVPMNAAASVASGLWNRYLEVNGGQVLPFKQNPPQLPPLDTVPVTVSKTIQVSNGVVLIDADTSSGTLAGTGMILTPNGKVLTNYHVIRGSETISVTVVDTSKKFRAKLVGCDETRDVALLQLDGGSDLATITPDNDPVAIGQAIKVVGNARGQGYLSTATGAIVAFNQTVSVRDESQGSKESVQIAGLIQATAKAVSGESGGPMMDEQNEVIGMTTAGSVDGSPRSYAIPIGEALDIVDEVIQGRETGTVRVGPAGYLGVSISGTDTGPGVLIVGITPNGPAAKSGLKVGDRLLGVAGKEVTPESVARIIRGVEPGAKAKISWETTGGKAKSAEPVFAESPIN